METDEDSRTGHTSRPFHEYLTLSFRNAEEPKKADSVIVDAVVVEIAAPV
jgi:hypothetical protein